MRLFARWRMSPADRAEALLDRYRRPAILLHRPFPPTRATKGNSRFGGVPTLPAELEWPRTGAGRPLHFLLQVDCSELPPGSELPERGTLFFFGNQDPDHEWGMTGDPRDDFRVMWAPQATAETPPYESPADLPMLGPYAARDVAFGQPADADARRTYVEWPIRILSLDSWPDRSALPELEDLERLAWGRWRSSRGKMSSWERAYQAQMRVFDTYGSRLVEARREAFAAATGEAEAGEFIYVWEPGRQIFGDGGEADAFPPYWVFVHFFARLMLGRYPREETVEAAAADAAAADAAARLWLQRSDEAGFSTPVDAESRTAFRHWAMDIVPTPHGAFPARTAEYAFGSAVWTIREWAADPALAARIGPRFYAAVAPYFANEAPPAAGDIDGPPWFRAAQMLGHAPSTQQARGADDPTLCLLYLPSDRGLGWNWGDYGECTFWISAEDLARRDFGRVEAMIEGG